MAVVAKDQFGADAADFAGGAGALHMAEVGEEVHEARQALGQAGLAAPFCFQLEDVQDELAGGQQPAQGVGQREGHALAGLVVELGAVGVGGVLQMVEGPEPELHGGGQRAGAGAGTLGGDAAHLGDPLLELGQEQLVGHGDGELEALDGFGAFVGGLELGVHPFLAQEPGQSSVTP